MVYLSDSQLQYHYVSGLVARGGKNMVAYQLHDLFVTCEVLHVVSCLFSVAMFTYDMFMFNHLLYGHKRLNYTLKILALQYHRGWLWQ